MGPWGLLPVLAALGAGAVEARRHTTRLLTISHRIHVNGTRGKSSVVRLVAAGLRAGGLRVVAKTTGTAPRVILPDGEEQDLRGARRPSLREYLQVTALAARYRVDALVIECMALRPEYQRVAERRLLRSTIGVMTGVDLDHLGVMGDSRDEIAETLAETIPAGALLIAPGPSLPEVWTARAAALSTVVRTVVPDPQASQPVGYVEWPENLAIAAEVCAAVGVDRATALAGMSGVRPDPGALRVWRLPWADVWLVGAFAVNDPVSTRRAIDRVRRCLNRPSLPVIGVLNTRADRGERTLQWCRALLAGDVAADRLIVTGPQAPATGRLLARRGWDRARLRVLARATPEAVTAEALSDPPGARLIVGMGNIAGAGAELLRHWATVGAAHQGNVNG